MKLLIIDTEFVGLDLAIRAQKAGHEVFYFQAPAKDGERRTDGDGMVTKIHDLDLLKKKYLGLADLIFLTDNTKYIELLEPYHKIGYPIFGPNVSGTKLELDREEGQRILKKSGLKIIPSKTFNDHDSAINYVEKEGRAMVSKQCGGTMEKAMSYVAHDAADLIYMLERWKKVDKYRAAAKQHGFLIQDKIKGIEFGVGGWFGPNGWSKYFFESFEFKKLMDGDLGVNTGEQGTLAAYTKKSKLAEMVLLPITDYLKEIGYVGYIDNNCMIDEKGYPWSLEFTCRPGWPLHDNMMALHLGDPAQWMLDLLNGRDTLKVNERDVSISVVISIPDYPYSRYTAKQLSGIPVYNANDLEHIHYKSVKIGQDVPTQIGDKVVRLPGLVTAGDYVCVVTGTGETITGARKSAYSAVKKVRIPNDPSYRLDIGKSRLIKQLPQLHKMGFATRFNF